MRKTTTILHLILVAAVSAAAPACLTELEVSDTDADPIAETAPSEEPPDMLDRIMDCSWGGSFGSSYEECKNSLVCEFRGMVVHCVHHGNYGWCACMFNADAPDNAPSAVR